MVLHLIAKVFTQCIKILKKVSFSNIARKASYFFVKCKIFEITIKYSWAILSNEIFLMILDHSFSFFSVFISR